MTTELDPLSIEGVSTLVNVLLSLALALGAGDWWNRQPNLRKSAVMFLLAFAVVGLTVADACSYGFVTELACERIGIRRYVFTVLIAFGTQQAIYQAVGRNIKYTMIAARRDAEFKPRIK